MKRFKVTRKCSLLGWVCEGVGEDVIQSNSLKEVKEYLRTQYNENQMKIKVTEFELEAPPEFYDKYEIEEIKE